MMKVTNISWLSKEAKEAELEITDGKYSCIVFSQPCDVSKGEYIHEPLHAFILEDLMISKNTDYFIRIVKPGSLSQQCVAKIIDQDECLIEIGEIKILLDDQLPAGSKEGDFIEFTCMRLDLW